LRNDDVRIELSWKNITSRVERSNANLFYLIAMQNRPFNLLESAFKVAKQAREKGAAAAVDCGRI
jgi:hypothetical protein